VGIISVVASIVAHISLSSIPNYSAETLTTWFRSDIPSQTARVVEYFMDRTAMVLEILDEAEVITKNAYAIFSLNTRNGLF